MEATPRHPLFERHHPIPPGGRRSMIRQERFEARLHLRKNPWSKGPKRVVRRNGFQLGMNGRMLLGEAVREDSGDRPAPTVNNKVAAYAHYVRSGERGTEAAPATSGRYKTAAGAEVERSS